MNKKTMEHFLDGLTDLKALVVGDLILDEYLWGDSERISPEAPVPIVDVKEKELRLGGAGNVISNLLDLGCKVDVAGVIGDDENGRLLLHLLEERNVSVDGLVTVSQRITSRKTRVLANRQQMLRIDNESCDLLTGSVENQLIENLQTKISDYDVVFISDYLKGVLTDRVTKALIQAGRNADIPVVVDPKGNDYTKYAGATLITPNRKEAELATGKLLRDEQSLIAGGEVLRSELSLDALLLTRSAEGMSLFTGDEVVHVPTRAREVFDVSGAGDTVLALVGAALAIGLEFADAARLANVGAGIVVGKLGTSTVSAAEIAQVVNAEQESGKIFDRQSLYENLQVNRQGKQVVFTNGCFDLLHVGHVKYLQKSRALGDLLIIGLNSDRSVRQLKGAGRPLISEEERAHILAALDCVDYVTIFDEETPLELIRLLTPDILVKGGDYSLDGVVGREEVEAHGGRVELVQFVDGKSTTNMIEKILSQYKEPNGC
jgi:D-beta-D-heptose 7-phosphate kinase/D-beta-D-heptose 1-phosphate adenosyltransferase